MKVLVAYSGGKDSQACLIWAVEKFGAKNIEAVFCDTGWEHPITYQHIEKTTTDLNVKLIAVKSKKYNGMVDMARKKTRFPSSQENAFNVDCRVNKVICLKELEYQFKCVDGWLQKENESNPTNNVTINNLDKALRMCNIEIHESILDKIIDIVELLAKKGDLVTIKDVCDIDLKS